MSDSWKLSGISRGEQGGPPTLGVLTPGGSLRRVPLSLRELVALIRNAALVLEGEMGEKP